MADTLTKPNGGISEVRKIGMDAPWQWLSLAAKDFMHKPMVSLFHGSAFTLAAIVIVVGLSVQGYTSIILALAGGFLIVGPMLAVGLYEKSRLIEAGERVHFGELLKASFKSPVGLAYVGILLMVIYLFWVRLAMIIFALFFGLGGFPPVNEFLGNLLLTGEGVSMLVVGTISGGVLAAGTFMATAVSVPMLMDRRCDTFSAVATSIRAVVQNPAPMALWATLIAGIMAVGMAVGFVGVMFSFPLIGHATWHAYKALVQD